MVKASLELTAWEVQPEFEPRCTHDTLGQAVETWGGGKRGNPQFLPSNITKRREHISVQVRRGMSMTHDAGLLGGGIFEGDHSCYLLTTAVYFQPPK